MILHLLTDSFAQSLWANTIGTILGGIVLGGVAFVFGEVLFGVAQVHGHWFVVTETRRARYKPYIGMKVTYRVLLTQEGNRLSGTGEKIMDETAAGVATTYDFAKRIRVDVSGYVRKRYLLKSEIVMHFVEHGNRDTSAMQVMTRKNCDCVQGVF
ncbi:MAG: hypothetical protein RBU21_00860, partial [FCB group bacterium]|nr:hypothetical protein [FCB group bacterium]